jgi:ketosteroid isomerase-like protein
MKLTRVILPAVALVVALSGARADAQGAGKDEKIAAVKKVDRKLTEALIKRDGKELDRLTSDDYVHISPNGIVYNKKQSIKGLTEEPRLTFEKIDDSEIKVAIYGNTAVMTGLSKMKGKSKTRGDFDEEYRFTRIFVLHDGNWLCVHEHLNRFFPPEVKK